MNLEPLWRGFVSYYHAHPTTILASTAIIIICLGCWESKRSLSASIYTWLAGLTFFVLALLPALPSNSPMAVKILLVIFIYSAGLPLIVFLSRKYFGAGRFD